MSKNYNPVFVAVACSVLMATWLFAAVNVHWSALACLWAAGILMAVVIKEKSAVRFLGGIFAGAVVFGVLSVGLFAVRASFVAWQTHDPHPPFGLSWAILPLMGMVAVLTFFGGLIGIFIKGLYIMAGRWADRLLLLVGPLVLTAASLAVERVKYGGTVLNHVHGWPYPLAQYAVSDVEGTPIGQWHVTLGTLLSNPIRDYLFYLLVLAGCYLMVRSALETLGRRSGGHWAVVGVLFGITLAGTVGLTAYRPLREAGIRKAIERASYCTETPDCEGVMNHGAFSCAITVNKAEVGRIRRLLLDHPEDFKLTGCGEMSPVCETGRCRAVFR